jgi:hypothetical protein
MSVKPFIPPPHEPGMEDKIVEIVYKLKKKYPDLGKYQIAFHKDKYKGDVDAGYIGGLQILDDASGFFVRFTDGTMLTVPMDAMNDWEKNNFAEKWGDKIYASKISRRFMK